MSLVACGEKEDDSNNVVNIDRDTTKETNEKLSNESIKETTTVIEEKGPKEEILNASWNSGLVQIEEKLGKPLEINQYMTYIYGYVVGYGDDLEYGMNVFIDRNTHIISKILISKNVSKNKNDTLQLVTFENAKNLQVNNFLSGSLLRESK